MLEWSDFLSLSSLSALRCPESGCSNQPYHADDLGRFTLHGLGWRDYTLRKPESALYCAQLFFGQCGD